MEIKKGAILAGLNICMRPVLMAANKIWSDAGQELVVTSGLDGTHSAGSKHYYGYALDFRTRYFDKDTKDAVFAELKKQLGNSFKCILHNTHMHVEWNGFS